MAEDSLIVNPQTGDQSRTEDFLKELAQLCDQKGYIMRQTPQGFLLARPDPQPGLLNQARVMAIIEAVQHGQVIARLGDWTPNFLQKKPNA